MAAKKIITAGLLLLLSLNLGAEVSWKEGFYKKFNNRMFLQYSPAKMHIYFSAIDSKLISASLFYALNFYRKKHGLNPFIYSKALRNASYTHSYHMVKENFYSSKSPVVGFENLAIRILNHGDFKGKASELLAIEYAFRYKDGTPFKKVGPNTFAYKDGTLIEPHSYISFALKVVSGWHNSKKHREIMLLPDFNFAGAGAWFYYLENKMLVAKVSVVLASKVIE
jgi:uncharacterized protein YkwD